MQNKKVLALHFQDSLFAKPREITLVDGFMTQKPSRWKRPLFFALRIVATVILSLR